MANILTVTNSQALQMAIYATSQLPPEPTSFDFTTLTIDTGVTIPTHTSATFRRVVESIVGPALEFEVVNSGDGTTKVMLVFSKNLASVTINTTAE
jgi:hypothetical protein